MKTLTAAASIALITSSVSAMDLPGGISIGGETVAEYNTDAEALSITIEPTMEKSWNGLDFSLSSVLDVYKNEEIVLLDESPTIDFEVSKPIWNIEIYAKTGWDLEAEERTDLTVGASFSF
jgi:hypothetical protein